MANSAFVIRASAEIRHEQVEQTAEDYGDNKAHSGLTDDGQYYCIIHSESFSDSVANKLISLGFLSDLMQFLLHGVNPLRKLFRNIIFFLRIG